ncbi:MAG: hypothetical protein GY941_11445 [Planctomycetes bacterium]|nr:hypothetical protein [Planctomycetota bacterium]
MTDKTCTLCGFENPEFGDGKGKHWHYRCHKVYQKIARQEETITELTAALQCVTVTELVEALELTERLITEALPKFDWGKSALDANAIELLNTVPSKVTNAIAKAKGQTDETSM